MPIAPNEQFDHYEILALIGKGGMGEVWRAHDTRLNRDVAIKFLPEALAQDAERLRRFELEARATGSLNHPNILTVHDIGHHEGAPCIVAELLEGETLKDCLDRETLPPRKALDYAQQIAQGLAAAHSKGIVHRDLKPANLFVTTDERVKILDFGLAKLTPLRNADFRMRNEEAETLLQADPNNPQSAIRNPQLTDLGTVMGTVGYMAPEQVRGEEADVRADIFAFGVLLYEMLSGQRAFTGDSAIEVMNAILKHDPPELTSLNPRLTPVLDRIVRRCLEKKPERRFHSASDLGFALEAVSAGLSASSGAKMETEPARPTRWFGNARLAWIVAAVAVLGLLAALPAMTAYFRRPPAESRATFTYLPLPEKTTTAIHGGAVLSPDGRRVVMVAIAEGTGHLWLYSLDRPAPVLLPGTEGARFPFWSPSGQSIGFFAQGKLKRIEASGGLPTTLCEAPLGGGGTWSSKGVILFSPDTNGAGLYQVAESGGTATLVTRLDAARFETGHNFPSLLPDGRNFVFFANSGQPEYRGIRLGSLDNPQTSFLLRADANAEYSLAGYLLFVRGRKILAQQFDPDKLALSGAPVPLTEDMHYEQTVRYADLSVFSNRVLLYRGGGNPNTQLVWFDRSGRQLAMVGPPGEYRNLQLSPDGRQVLLGRTDPQVETNDIWEFDLLRETLARLTSNPAHDINPIWSPDGDKMVFTSIREGFFGIYQKSGQKGVSGDDKEELLFRGDSRGLFISDWSKDGKFIVYCKAREKTGLDIVLLPLSGDLQPHDYLATQFDEYWAKVSPDGRWLAYQSTESGRYEIYVQSFPEPGRKVTVSKGGGVLPRWRSDGKELYYIAADDKLMAVPVEMGTNFSVGAPVALFDVGSLGRRRNSYVYDVSADGQKILLIRPLEDASTRPLTVVQNWTELLKK